ncbi:MAG: 2-oxo acid dehydrogenase subunit E2 [Thermoleophilia bacterium]|nr:2-oxo acid dehydrogenase subunit E2 [Thermoleophilia bacterium]
MPKLSDSMADAVIVRWLKGPGEAFARGEALIEVETDKATVIYEAEEDGTLGSILVPEGSAAAVGEPIATLGNGEPARPREQVEAVRRPAPPQQDAAAAEPAAPPPPRPPPTSGDGAEPRRPNASPVARRTAVELGVSLHGLTGTGPSGRITREDVRRAAAAAPPSDERAAAGTGHADLVALTPTQATIARRMLESATTIPVFSVTADVDMSAVVALRREARDQVDAVPSLNDFVIKAAAAALREFPRFNASYRDGQVAIHSRVNVGVAVATDDALLVPVVFDADRRTVAEIARETRRLADAARRRALRPEELHDGTFTVSNLGMFGTRSFTAIIDPPQVAILAVGAVRRAAVEDERGAVAFRDVMTVTLTCDHRVVYGAHGAQFLTRLRELLERPLALLI